MTTTKDPAAAAAPLDPPPKLTEEEIDACMATGPDWPHPGKMDGWFKSHQALRADMKDLAEALEAVAAGICGASSADDVIAGTGGGVPLEKWQVANLQKYWPIFYRSMVMHHDHEEKLFFPFLETKFKLPPKMTADHKALIASMDAIGKQIEGLTASGKAPDDCASIANLLADFKVMRELVEVHLKEEDDEGLPLMRKYFTFKETKPIENKIVADLTLRDIGWILRPMDKVDRKLFLGTIIDAPAPVKALLMAPQPEKYIANVQVLINDLKAGAKTKPAGLFACFSC
ncbi:hypothetical protein FOA52_000775 [Chlamydomonas sp. UWO 241]|nr:hypothetical protein FOA52_000775 [Chlamydomonas sp. UWO 241]